MPYNSLQSIRDQKGLTVAQLAGKTSISIRTLQSYEAGEKAILPDDLRKLSRVLVTTPTDILRQPATPPVPPPAPVAIPVPAQVAAPVTLRVAQPSPPPPVMEKTVDQPPLPPRPRPFLRAVDDAPPAPPRPRPVRAPREVRPPRPPGPSSAGQQEQIRHLARRMGLDDDALAERLSAPLASLDHSAARDAIARLRREMEESGTWQPRVGEGPDQEAEYLGKVRERRMILDVRLIDGTELSGTIVDFTSYVIRLRRDDGTETSVRKLAIAYYQTREAVDDPQ
jgi:sRNA-binding regulator protein Hfq